MPVYTVTGQDQDGRTATTRIFRAGVNAATVLAGIQTTKTSATTLSTAGTTVNRTMFRGGKLSVTAPDVTINDSIIMGSPTSPNLITCTNIAVKRLKLNRCLLIPYDPVINQVGIVGHDFELYDCMIEEVADGVQINNGSQYNVSGPGFPTGVIMRRTVIRRLARWTASQGGIVHPSDSLSHNDDVQQFGGVGTDIEDCVLDARPARQFAHLYLQSPSGHVYTREEAWKLPDDAPLISVPNGSLADGGPFAAPADATHPARDKPFELNGTGLLSRGNLSRPDFACMMLNNSLGYSAGFRVVGNLFVGGEYAVNGGGNPYPGNNISLGTWNDNWFTHDQGSQGGGLNDSHTLNFGGTWSGRVTATGNRYLDGPAIRVRP